jgi:hypothetical protein
MQRLKAAILYNSCRYYLHRAQTFGKGAVISGMSRKGRLAQLVEHLVYTTMIIYIGNGAFPTLSLFWISGLREYSGTR